MLLTVLHVPTMRSPFIILLVLFRCSAGGLSNRSNPLLGPVLNSIYNGFEGAPFLGKLIFDAHRDLRIHDALHDPLHLQLTQAIAEHAIRKALHQRS